MRKFQVVTGLVAGAALAAVFAGCSGKYGAIQFDVDATRSCESAQVLPAHTYYFTGSESSPDVILALRDDRPQGSDLWRPVAMTPELFAKLVGKMRGTRTDGPTGSYVTDDRGTRIGVWCSYLRPGPVKILEDGGVVIPLPQDSEIMRNPGSRGKD